MRDITAKLLDTVAHLLYDSNQYILQNLRFSGDEDQLSVMSERALKAAKPDASAEIVEHIVSLVAPSSSLGN